MVIPEACVTEHRTVFTNAAIFKLKKCETQVMKGRKLWKLYEELRKEFECRFSARLRSWEGEQRHLENTCP